MTLRDLFKPDPAPEVVTLTLVGTAEPFQAQVTSIFRTRDGVPVAVHARTQADVMLIPWASIISMTQPRP